MICLLWVTFTGAHVTTHLDPPAHGDPSRDEASQWPWDHSLTVVVRFGGTRVGMRRCDVATAENQIIAIVCGDVGNSQRSEELSKLCGKSPDLIRKV